MELKYKKERLLLLEEIYSQKGTILSEEGVINFKKKNKMNDEEFEDMIEILTQRKFIEEKQKITHKGNSQEDGYVNVTITFGVGELKLTGKGLNYLEERLEK